MTSFQSFPGKRRTISPHYMDLRDWYTAIAKNLLPSPAPYSVYNYLISHTDIRLTNREDIKKHVLLKKQKLLAKIIFQIPSLKNFPLSYIKSLTSLANSILILQIFPNRWKNWVVILTQKPLFPHSTTALL